MVGTSELEEMRRRLEALEGEVARLREESATTRTLAAMADRDVAEMRAALRGHTQVLGALRETQLEQGQATGRTLDAHGRMLEQIAGVVGSLVQGQAQILDRLDRIASPPQD
ncbi:hypothetical protein [Streptomyces atacamensis]|uniref:hypothetical protein n=1 Tax=Streptomyces atacamensis TaxID=531966 RepID=UPI00399CD49C